MRSVFQGIHYLEYATEHAGLPLNDIAPYLTSLVSLTMPNTSMDMVIVIYIHHVIIIHSFP